MKILLYARLFPKLKSRIQLGILVHVLLVREWCFMRVLVLTLTSVYPADAGSKIKTLQVMRHLATHHNVVYCTFVRSIKENQYAQELLEICCRVSTVPIKRSWISDIRFLLESLVSGDAFLLRRDDRTAMRSVVSQLLDEENIDILHINQLNMMRFVPKNWSGIVILDAHDALWQVVERLRKGVRNPLTRWFLAREARLIRRLEGSACQRAQVVLAVSEEDRQALQEVAGEAVSIKVVPITVDVRSCDAIWEARNPHPNRLLTIGTMFWPPNSEGVIWWLKEGYERLHAFCPDLTYDIVGPRPPRALQALARRYKGVNVHGYVADIVPFWTNATVLVVPILSGGGVRVKILEAMAMGLPVISTTIGCEGLAVRDGEHLLIADTPETFANACLMLLQDQKLAHYLAQNAHRLVLERYDVSIALHTLDETYEEARSVLIKY
jgi:glycosyltransferase involved in cell wall biosynthesis